MFSLPHRTAGRPVSGFPVPCPYLKEIGLGVPALPSQRVMRNECCTASLRAYEAHPDLSLGRPEVFVSDVGSQ